jgi:NhaP-type Na+/H+ or K+/H+ antiporter
MVLEEEQHVEVVILAPFLLLTVGAFLRQTTKSLPIPYTLQLLIVGIVLGFLLRNSGWDDALQKSVARLGEMDPHLLLHVFLPPLVFESAASLEWNLFTRSKFHIIFLAGPGLLLASTLTAIALFNILNYSSRFNNDLLASECPQDAWSFSTALLLGVIMSATDPVAVVALLKDLGCKASLATTIEGESLLNDGTALVMYTILIKLTEGDTSDNIGDYLLTFVKMSIGGALFGIAFAAVVVQWLRMVFNDSLTEITITLCAAYLCFFIAEYFLNVSGVLAVVCLGLYFGQIGRTSVSPEVAHFLEEFWQCLGYIGNTLIFVVAGTVIGFKLPAFPASEFGQMIVMYIICTVVRALVFLLSFLIFNAFGYKLEFRDQIVATW